MPRPQCCRRISRRPAETVFRPGDGPPALSGEVLLTLDEFEAIRLSDLEGMYQEDAAGRMNVSRQTLGRILASAHRKVAEALTLGKSIRIEGGTIRIEKKCSFRCATCALDEEGRQIGEAPCPRLREGVGAGAAGGAPPGGGHESACPGLRRRRRGCPAAE